MTDLILYALVGSLLSLAGGLIFLLVSKAVLKYITPLLAFSAGAFLGVTFFDLLPEAVEAVEEPHSVFIAALVGFVFFFALERFLMKYFHVHGEGKAHGDHTESLSLLIVLGDTLHNFLDGIVIALAFVADPTIGLATALAVAAHEIPQEIGDFTVLLDRGWSKAKIIVVNVISSLLTVVGALFGYYAAVSFEHKLPFLLAGVSGVFLYIAASDLVPEVHHRAGHKHFFRIIFSLLVGLVFIWFLVGLAHE